MSPASLRYAPLILAACLMAGESGPAGIALASRGKVFSGPLGIDQRGLAVGATVLALDDLVAASQPVDSANWLDQGVVTVAGDQLRGLPRSFEKGQLILASGLLGQITLTSPKLAGIVLGPVRFTAIQDLLAGKPGAVLANGDRVEGNLAFLNSESVGIDNGRRIVSVQRTRVQVVTMGAAAPSVPSKPRLWLRLSSGDRVNGDAWRSASGAITVESVAGTVTAQAATIASVWAEGGRLMPLTAIPATKLICIDRMGANLPIGRDAQPSGGWLNGAGLRAERGLQLPARGEGIWPVAGYGTFLAWVACAPGASGGQVQLRLDGQVAWDSGAMVPGQPPRAIEIPLKGARDLQLSSLPGTDGETALRAITICFPMLVK